MHLQNLLAPLNVGQTHIHLTVEATGTEQGRVENIRAVGGSQHHHALIAAKAVHLDQKLVQRLLALIVTAADTRAALTTHRVDLVDKDDGGGDLLRLIEEVTDAACAHTYIHFHKVRTGNGEEAHPRFACHSLCQQGLTGTGRTHQQHAVGDASTEIVVLLGLFQKIHDLKPLFLFLLRTCHIRKGDLGHVILFGFGAGGAELRHAVPAAAAVHHNIEQEKQGCRQKEIGDQLRQPTLLLKAFIIVVLNDAGFRLLLHQFMQRVIEKLEVVQLMPDLLVAPLVHHVWLVELHLQLVALNAEALDLLLLKQRLHLTVADLIPCSHLHTAEKAQRQHQQQGQQEKGRAVGSLLIQSGFLLCLGFAFFEKQKKALRRNAFSLNSSFGNQSRAFSYTSAFSTPM